MKTRMFLLASASGLFRFRGGGRITCTENSELDGEIRFG